VEATIAEISRINPVGPMALPHVPLNDTELGGYNIKKVINSCSYHIPKCPV
jgi:cytochrome P450